jgi:hypothetical protein
MAKNKQTIHFSLGRDGLREMSVGGIADNEEIRK